MTVLSLSFVTVAYSAGADASRDVAHMVSEIPDAAFAAPVLMIGESHRRSKSHAFVRGLIQRALAQEKCVTFALEMPSNQTAGWRSLADESEVVESLAISPIHDSPSLRNLLKSTSELAQHGCLKLDAIDDVPTKSIDHAGGRDYRMAEHIAELATDDRIVIALVGGNHAPRHVDWDYDEPSQSTTFYLAERGIDTYVIVQDWVEVEAPRVMAGDGEAAVSAYNTLQWSRSVVPATTFTRYADRLIQWPDIGTSEFSGSK